VIHPAPRPITVADAARALGVSERTVWRYLKSGRLAGETVGPPGERRTLIPADAVAELSEGRANGATLEALRAERDRLAAELEAAESARAGLEARVSMLQRALARPARPALVERALGRALRRPSRLSNSAR
jgi:excisionase family DNA binding protein